MIHKEIPVVTQFGEGLIETITITESKQLIVRIRYGEVWINHPIGNIEESFKSKEILFKEPVELS